MVYILFYFPVVPVLRIAKREAKTVESNKEFMATLEVFFNVSDFLLI